MRNVTLRDKSFQSSERGKIIKSNRTFGVEIEAVTEDEEKIVELEDELPHSFGLVHDGSIQTSMGGTAIEVITPILKGKKGEEAIIDSLKEMRRLEFELNKSCGLHVHLGSDGFGNSNKSYSVPFCEFSLSKMNKIERRDESLVIIEYNLLSKLVSITGSSVKDIANILRDEYSINQDKVLFLSKEFGVKVPEITVRPSLILVEGKEAIVLYYTSDDFLRIPKIEKEFFLSEFAPKGEDIVFILSESQSLEKLKALLYFYTVFNDIFLSMLPVSRRTNVYCQSLSTSFSPVAIESLDSYGEIEKQWYRSTNMQSTLRHKNSHYDNSRYYNLNLHPLFSGKGTIEIRSHSATLLSNKVLLWTALHQHIFDMIEKNNLTIGSMRPATIMNSLEEKMNLFFSITYLNHQMRTYVTKRIDYFNDLKK